MSTTVGALPGDLVFCHSTGTVSRAIRIAEWFRRDWSKASERPGDKWNHVAILDTPLPDGDWTVIQAEGRGVTNTARLSQVAPGGSYDVVPLWGAVHNGQLLTFARSQVGFRYGFLTIACIALTLLTPHFISFTRPHTWICSALAGESLRFGGWLHDWASIYDVSPAQLWVAVT